MRLNDHITSLKGVGEKTAQLLEKMGIQTIGQLLYFFPRDYMEIPYITPISDALAKTTVIIKGKIEDTPRVFSSRGKTILMFRVNDGTGSLEVSYFGMPYLKKTYFKGMEVIFYGRTTIKNGRMILAQPKRLTDDDYIGVAGTFQPVYRVPKGLTTSKIQKMVTTILDGNIEMGEYLSEDIINSENLITIKEAIRNIHLPLDMASVNIARTRLAFDEFYLFLMQLQLLKYENDKPETDFIISEGCDSKLLLKGLPYELTEGQKNALDDIYHDMKSGFQMNRLVQGDVGCGKTIIAFLSMLNCISMGKQAALMAPTEVLASQHYEDICKMKEKYHLNVNPGLLIGSMTSKEKKEIKKQIISGEIDFLIGTHALIQDSVEFKELALVVCDEQHRFGVGQRLKLLNKGAKPHILVMSATPIPRTLGLILYGDLDVSLITELPANRKPIKNTVVGPEYREKLYQFIGKQISEGRQAYIICPMVEENEDLDIQNVMDYSAGLKEIFPPYVQIEALHGKMKPKEKDEIMSRFARCDTHILVSTTVVEVGVNVPNATVMMVENAERFGLSQLHQLRGRVGRGNEQSYCIFLIGNDSKKAEDRLSIMAKTNNGFEIANEDLKQRGPGDFFGYRQSGMPGFQIADIYSDSIILERVKNIIEKQLRQEPDELKELYSQILDRPYYHFMNLHDVCL